MFYALPKAFCGVKQSQNAILCSESMAVMRVVSELLRRELPLQSPCLDIGLSIIRCEPQYSVDSIGSSQESVQRTEKRTTLTETHSHVLPMSYPARAFDKDFRHLD